MVISTGRSSDILAQIRCLLQHNFDVHLAQQEHVFLGQRGYLLELEEHVFLVQQEHLSLVRILCVTILSLRACLRS